MNLFGLRNIASHEDNATDIIIYDELLFVRGQGLASNPDDHVLADKFIHMRSLLSSLFTSRLRCGFCFDLNPLALRNALLFSRIRGLNVRAF